MGYKKGCALALKDQITEASNRCKFTRIYETYSAADKATLARWVAGDVSARRIAVAMVSDNEANRISRHTIINHLSGYCNCNLDAALKGERASRGERHES